MRLSRSDLEVALEFVHAASLADDHEPFSAEILDSLARLIPGDFIAYYEWDLSKRRHAVRRVEVPPVDEPREVAEATYHYRSTYPLSNLRLATATHPGRLSDFVSPCALRRLDYCHYVLRPLGFEHQIRLWPPAPPDKSRVFYFNRGTGRDFSERDIALLDLLRPFLVALHERFALREAPTRVQDGLTSRETEILRWVAVGKTNQEIAALLFLSAHTVRKHLENIYVKLGVHRRTAAVARASALGG